MADVTRAELEGIVLDAEELGAQQQRGQVDMPHLLVARKRLVARLEAIVERAIAEAPGTVAEARVYPEYQEAPYPYQTDCDPHAWTGED